MPKYSIGLDFGSLSGRAVLVDVQSGEECAEAAFDYPHAVMDRALPDGTPLGADWALQHPMDYLEVLYHVIPEVMAKSMVNAQDVIGIGVDFTACTVLPVTEDGTPLCFEPQWQSEPHAYVKLWKHHAAQARARKITKIAKQRKEWWLDNYGGTVSSEWSLPRLWELCDEAPAIYAAMREWVEAGDWIVWQLTGVKTRNSCAAGYKYFYHKEKGYPNQEFLSAIDPRLENAFAEKVSAPVLPIGSCAGFLTETMAEKLGLAAGTPVAVANVDAHVCVPAVGMNKPGQMLEIMGTSGCHMTIGRDERPVKGICGVVKDGIMPGFYGYEAGQSCVGDHFAWFTKNCVPQEYFDEASKQGVHIQTYLTELANKLRPGESGLLALDWWNGNRSILVDVDLTGMILGMTLQTRPEEIYRALIEATAFGTRVIVENFRAGGVPVNEFFVSGGISQKNAMAMQIYADVLNMPVKIGGSMQGPALGSAIFGAVAAGSHNGGYDEVFTAAERMGKVKDTVYLPNAQHVTVYDQLFAEYKQLHDYFGCGGNDVMKRLKLLKNG